MDDNTPAVVVALQYGPNYTDKRGEKLEGYEQAIVFMQHVETIATQVTPTNPTGEGKVLRCKAVIPAWVARALYDRPGSETTWRVEYQSPGVTAPAAPTGPPPGEHTIAGLRAKAKELGKAFPASVSKAEILAWLQEQESA